MQIVYLLMEIYICSAKISISARRVLAARRTATRKGRFWKGRVRFGSVKNPTIHDPGQSSINLVALKLGAKLGEKQSANLCQILGRKYVTAEQFMTDEPFLFKLETFMIEHTCDE